MKCQFYKAPITNTSSRQAVNLAEVYQYITTDAAAQQHTTALRDIVARLATGEATEAEVRAYKANHFDFVLFSGLFRSRTDAGLFVHSGLLCLDMDHLGGPEAVSTLRQKLLHDPCFPTLLLFTSPGGDGVKWVIHIDLQRCPSHHTWFLALEQYVKERYGVAIDRKCSNLSRACFLPHDPNCYLHPALHSTLPHPSAQGAVKATTGMTNGATTNGATMNGATTNGAMLPVGNEPFAPLYWAARNPQQQPAAGSTKPVAENTKPAVESMKPAAESGPTCPTTVPIDQVAKAISRSKEHLPAASAQAAAAAADDPAEAIRYYADLCTSRGIDLTVGYDNWLRLGFALSDIFGESGREIYHKLSRLNSAYDPRECDGQYTSCLRSKGTGVTYRSFFDLLRRAGIDLSAEARNRRAKQDFAPITEEMLAAESAKSAKGPFIPISEKIEKNTLFPFLEEEKDKGTTTLLAQTATKTFSDKIERTEWPAFCLEILDSQTETSDKDKMILGSINLISGLLPESLYSIYDRRKVYAPLYNILYGGFATKKGDLEACKQLVAPIKLEMEREYKAQREAYEEEFALWDSTPKATRGKAPEAPVRRSPFVPANSSASAVFRSLEANGGWGIMCETEADSLTNMLSKSEYGDYSDLLRKAHHHEACPMVRVSEHLFIELEKPRLSVLLTCTGSQLPLLLPASNVANGLASRFLFYALPDSKVEFRNVFEGSDTPIEEIYRELGRKVQLLYHSLLDRSEHPIQFMLTTAQQQTFIRTFNDMLQEQYAMMGEGIQGYIFRLALECFRYTMVLTALRRLSERYGTEQPLFDDDEQALLCDERDFRIATTIIECLVNHTARVFAVIGNHDDDPFAKLPTQPSNELKRFFKELPQEREFKTAEAIEIAHALSIPERTAKRFLGDLVTKYLVLDHPHHGVYIKLRKEARHD